MPEHFKKVTEQKGEVLEEGGLFSRKGMPRLRWIIQGVYLLFFLLVGVEFVLFYEGVVAGNLHIYRPPSVEGFLPISSLLGLKYFLATGNYDTVHPAGLTIIMAVIVSSFLTKKTLCAWICPVGTLSRGLASFSRKAFKINVTVPPLVDHILISIKYFLCAFFLYVIFVKMSVQSVKAFIETPYNIVADAKMLLFFRHMSPGVAVTLILLVVLSLWIKNFWCRYLCPYGAFLGAFALISPGRISRDENTCISCTKCTKECPYQIRVHQKRAVKTMECTGCLTCVSVCPVNDCLTVEYPGRKRVREAAVPLLLLALLLSFYLTARVTGKWVSHVDKGTFSTYYSVANELDHPR